MADSRQSVRDLTVTVPQKSHRTLMHEEIARASDAAQDLVQDLQAQCETMFHDVKHDTAGIQESINCLNKAMAASQRDMEAMAKSTEDSVNNIHLIVEAVHGIAALDLSSIMEITAVNIVQNTIDAMTQDMQAYHGRVVSVEQELESLQEENHSLKKEVAALQENSKTAKDSIDTIAGGSGYGNRKKAKVDQKRLARLEDKIDRLLKELDL